MLRYCLSEASSLRAADLNLKDDQIGRFARAFSTDPVIVQGMTLTNVMPSSHRLIAAKAVQSCPTCGSSHQSPRPVLLCQLLGRRITCPLCGGLLQDLHLPFGDSTPPPVRE